MTATTTTRRAATTTTATAPRMDRDYRYLYIWDYDSLPAESGIPRERFSNLRLVRRGGALTLLLSLHGENRNPFEQDDSGAVVLTIPCPTPAEANDFLARVRAEKRARRASRREAEAEAYVRAPWTAYRAWHADHNVMYAGAHEQSAAANPRTKDAQDFHPLLGCREEVIPAVWGETLEGVERFVSFTNPRPGIDVEEYFEFQEGGDGSPVLHTIVTVWQKGVRKLRSEAAGAGGYKEGHRERELTWPEAADLLRAWTAEAEAQAAAKEAAKAAKAADQKYRELWQNCQGMEIDGYRVSTEYGGPHVADSAGNYLFPIPRDIRSYSELREKMEELLEDYYANCE